MSGNGSAPDLVLIYVEHEVAPPGVVSSVTVPAFSLDRMRGSSQQAAHFALQATGVGDVSYAIASGVESMTRALRFSDTGDGGSGLKVNSDLQKKQDLVYQGEGAERIAEK